MAPKAKVAKGAAPAKTGKATEDKTFGLKNKKGAKVQKYVAQVQASGKPSLKEQRLAEPSRKDKKRAEEEAAKELAALFSATIKQPKVPPGVDPKTILCEFFRHGQCTKGFKCKFSHDLDIERKKKEKADLFADRREEDEGMEDWDQEQLEKAIAQKHALENSNRPTDIVCRYFIDAVEKRQYGWFWQCPNGKECKYRHALPPGYVLKSQMKQLLAEEAANSKSLEEMIEEERAQVDAKTPITEGVFQMWKTQQEAERHAVDAEKEAERRRRGVMTGREIFAEEGFVAQDDASASDAFKREVDEEAEIKRMHAEAAIAMERARVAGGGAALEGSGSAEATAPAVQLTEQDAEDLFGSDEDDDDDDDVLNALTEDLAKPGTLAA